MTEELPPSSAHPQIRRDLQCPWNSAKGLCKPSQLQMAGVWEERPPQASHPGWAPHGTAWFVMELKTASFQVLLWDFHVREKVLLNWQGVGIT